MNDAVQLAARHACERFGQRGDGIFNAAGFGLALNRLAGLRGGIDGNLVAAILCGRDDIKVLRGGSHFRLLEEQP